MKKIRQPRMTHRRRVNSSANPAGVAGWTLIEIIVVIAVIVILAGVSVPVTTGILSKSKVRSTQAEMDGLAEAIRAYGKDRGFDPKTIASGRFLPEHKAKGAYKSILGVELENDVDKLGWNPVLRRGWNGPYITGSAESVDADGDGKIDLVRGYQVDSWGRYYVYTNRDEKGGKVTIKDVLRVVKLVSGGPDRDPGTAGDNLEMTVFEGPIY